MKKDAQPPWREQNHDLSISYTARTAYRTKQEQDVGAMVTSDYDAVLALLAAAVATPSCALAEIPTLPLGKATADERARILRMLESLAQGLGPDHPLATGALAADWQRARSATLPSVH